MQLTLKALAAFLHVGQGFPIYSEATPSNIAARVADPPTGSTATRRGNTVLTAAEPSVPDALSRFNERHENVGAYQRGGA